MRVLANLLCCGLLVLSAGCGGFSRSFQIEAQADIPREPASDLALVGYTIQVGAFKNLDNAVRLMHKLDGLGLDAYYYRHSSGLFKVRFGDFGSKKAARMRALRLRNAKLIESYYIVDPADYAIAAMRHYNGMALRGDLVSTARKFIGIPYRWGGESAKTGFDCSGLTMTVYKMNGLNLPRNSRAQFQAGRSVAMDDLRPGDLVFFATNGGRRVTHVGIYAGDGRFIHAPRKGKTIRTASLANSYFRKYYVGARTYLRRQG
jgi:cell wall-associated NlpC family hydrolase